MKNKFLLIILIALFATNINAQNISIDWGVANPESSKKFTPTSFIGKDAKFIYLLRRENNLTSSSNDYIEKYTVDNLTRVYSKEIKQENYRRIKFILLKDKLLLISEVSKKKNHALYVTEINSEGVLSNTSKKLLEVEFNPIGEYSDISNDDYFIPFKIVMSADKTSFFAYLSTIQNGILNICKVNSDLSIEQSTISLELTEKSLVELAILENNGVAIIKTPVKKKNDQGDKYYIYKYSYTIIDLKTAVHTINSFELNNQMKIINSSIQINHKNEIYFYGFYNSGNESEQETKGIFCTKIDIKTGKKINEFEFDYDEVTAKSFGLARDKSLVKKNMIYGMIIQSIISKEDGGIILLCEKNYEGSTGSYSTHIAGNILILNTSANSELTTKTIIPKYQQSDSWIYGKYNSIFHVYINEKLHLVYNDSPKNFNGNDQGKYGEPIITHRFVSSTELTIAHVTIEKSGEWKKEELQKYNVDSPVLMPLFSLPINKHESIIYSEKPDYIQIAKIKY